MSELREIQLVELRILKAVAELCDRYNLRYTLYCGTLLGAVRHKGFIPWDNDVDIAMPLSDYLRFLEVADELPPGYVMQSPQNTRDATMLWAKVYADGTTYLPKAAAAIDVHWGISIDVYPFIGEAASPFGRRVQRGMLQAAKYLRLIEFSRITGINLSAKTPAERFGKLILRAIPKRARSTVSNALLRRAMRDSSTAENIGTIDAATFNGKFKPSYWREMTAGEFEGCTFPIPAKYDIVLTLMYGKWRTPTPEIEHEIHFRQDGSHIYDVHRDYREYQKELLELQS